MCFKLVEGPGGSEDPPSSRSTRMKRTLWEVACLEFKCAKNAKVANVSTFFLDRSLKIWGGYGSEGRGRDAAVGTDVLSKDIISQSGVKGR